MSEGDEDNDQPSLADLDEWDWVDPREEHDPPEGGEADRGAEAVEAPNHADSPEPSRDGPPEASPDGPEIGTSGNTSIADLKPRYQTNPGEFYFLWFLAVLAYGIGDSVTTGMVLLDPTVNESNPFVEAVLQQFGLQGFVVLKLVVFAVLVLIGVKGAIDRDLVSYYGPPLMAIVMGTALTIWNLTVVG